MQHVQMNRIPTQRKTSMRRVHAPQQLAEDLCTLAGLRGGCSRYDLDLLMDALDSEPVSYTHLDFTLRREPAPLCLISNGFRMLTKIPSL